MEGAKIKKYDGLVEIKILVWIVSWCLKILV